MFPERLLYEIPPDLVFLSRGPGLPKEQGVSERVGAAIIRGLPVVGVCLGHQGIAEHFGGKLHTLEHPVHGKSSKIFHNEKSFFKGLPNPFSAGRYHSLYVDRDTLPECFDIIANTEDGVIMGIQHKTLSVAAVQFHPESILTLKDKSGLRLINKVMTELAGKSGHKEGQ